MERLKISQRILFLMLACGLCTKIYAQSPPTGFTYQGRIYKSNGVDTVNSSAVHFRLQIYAPNGTCLLYEETFTQDMSNSDGMFSLLVGSGTNSHVTSLSLLDVFDNSTAKTGASNCAYTPTTGDSRRVRFAYNDGTEALTFPTDQYVQSVPYAMTAQNLEGLSKSKILQVTAQTTQTKLDNVFTNYTDLMGLLNGNSTLYSKASDLPMAGGILNLSSGGVKVSDTPTSGQFAVNKNYSDSRLGGQSLDLSGLSNGQSLTWNASTNKWQAVHSASGTVTSITAGTGLSGGTITGSGIIALSNVGTAGTYTKVTTNAQGQVTAGSSLAASDIPAPAGDISGAYSALVVSKIRGVTVSSTAPTNGQVLKYNAASSQWESGSDYYNAGTVTSVTALSPLNVATGTNTPQISLQAGSHAGQALAWDGSQWSSSYLNVSSLKTAASLSQFPTTGCGVSKTLVYQVPTDTYDCVSIAITASQVSGLGAAATMTTGSTAGTLAAGNDSRLVNAVQPTASVAGDLSGGVLNPTVAKIQGVEVSSNTPNDGEVLKYNSNSGQWEPASDNTSTAIGGGGSVTSITAGTGLSGGTITGTGTISLSNVGTAGTYAKVTTNAQGRVTAGSSLAAADIPAPAGDVSGTYGALVVSKLHGVDVSSSTPTNGQVLKFNSTTSQWEPGSDTINTGTVSNVSASAPLSITNGSTTPQISLHSGSAAGQVLAWDGSQWSSDFINASSLKTAAALTQFPTTGCGASKTMVYQVPSDTYTCVSISIAASQVSGLGTAATLNTGTSAGTVAAGDDSRIVSAVQPNTNMNGDLSGTFANSSIAKIKGVALSATAPNDGEVLKFNATSNQWEASADVSNSGTVTSITAGTGLSGGTIIGSGTISLSSVGTAGTYAKVTTDAQGRVTAGTTLTASDIPAPAGDVSGTYGALVVSKINGVTLSTSTPTNGQVLKYNSTTSQWEAGTDTSNAGTVTSVTVTAPLNVTNGSSTPALSLQSGTSTGQALLWNGSAWSAGFSNISSLKTAAALTQFPSTGCTAAKTLVYQTPTDTYTCTDISISASQVSGLGNVAGLSVGTAAGTVAAGDDSRIVGALQSSTSIGGDLSGTMSTPTVAKIRGVAVASSAPTNGQILKYNSSTSQWEPGTDTTNTGTVTSITAGTGLTGGTVTASGTLAVDVGTSASQVVQLDSSAKLPAVDGSQLTGLPIPFSNAQAFNSSGNFTVPAKITKVYVQAWGGGGGGGNGGAANSAGGGGGGGGYSSGFVTVTPGSVIAVNVGSGGAAVSDGTASTFATTVIVASGGTKGLSSSGATSPGGAGSGTSALVTVSGGAGAGGSGYALASGAAGGFGGSAGGGGGSGGGGGGSGSNAGAAGAQPGGGGGGGGSSTASAAAGGAGGAGRVIVWY